MNESFLLFVAFALFSISCVNISEKTSTGFQGDPVAVLLAEQMFDAVGGEEAWCSLISLYIKAEHIEPQMEIPYTSEIWRATDRFELVIEQKSDSFHVKGVFTPESGTIRYYDKRDTFRLLTPEQLEEWEFDHQHNVYVLLHDIGCHPGNYTVQLEEDGRLSFYQDSAFVTAFEMDEQMRPYLFYPADQDGNMSGGSTFTHWGTDDGLVHSAGGHPLDSSFMYRTELWQPSDKTLVEAFGPEIFKLN